MKLTKDTIIEGKVIKEGAEVTILEATGNKVQEAISGMFDTKGLVNLADETYYKLKEYYIGEYFDVVAKELGYNPNEAWDNDEQRDNVIEYIEDTKSKELMEVYSGLLQYHVLNGLQQAFPYSRVLDRDSSQNLEKELRTSTDSKLKGLVNKGLF